MSYFNILAERGIKAALIVAVDEPVNHDCMDAYNHIAGALGAREPSRLNRGAILLECPRNRNRLMNYEWSEFPYCDVFQFGGQTAMRNAATLAYALTGQHKKLVAYRLGGDFGLDKIAQPGRLHLQRLEFGRGPRGVRYL
jgi:hypothetical protein